MLKGIDISKHQGEVDWDRIKNECDFTIFRSSYGTGNKDIQFDRNRDEARRVGILRGFYHYGYPEYNSPEFEAKWFCDFVGELQSGEWMVLDYESDWDGDQVDWCKRFLEIVSSRYGGYRPLIYMDLNRTRSADWSSIKNDYKLWLARWDYNPDAPAPDTGWDTPIRQYSNSGNIAGISPCDMNVFYGDKSQFNNLGFGGSMETCFVDKPMATAIATNFINWLYGEQNFIKITDCPKRSVAVTWLLENNMDFAGFMKTQIMIMPICPEPEACVCPPVPECVCPSLKVIEKEMCNGKSVIKIIGKLYWIK